MLQKGGAKSQQVKHFRRALWRTAKVAILALFLIIISWEAWNIYWYQYVLRKDIESHFGVYVQSPYILSGSEQKEVLVVELETGSCLRDVGFNDGDIVVSHSITDFYRDLYNGADNSITFVVVGGGDGSALSERTQRTISFVPNDACGKM